MSDPAEKRAAHIKEESTGRFAIPEETRRGTVLPPRGDDPDLVSLEDVGAVELEAEDRTEVAAGTALPRGMVSGVFSSGAQPSAPPPIPAEALQVGLPSHLDPREEARRSERARLEVEDFSLRFDNPYAASSLVPPPRKPVSAAKVFGVAALALALAGGGWFAVRQLTAADPAPAAYQRSVNRAPAPAAPQQQQAAQTTTKTAPAAVAPTQSAPVIDPVRNTAATPGATAEPVQPAPAKATAETKAAIEPAAPVGVLEHAPTAAVRPEAQSQPAASVAAAPAQPETTAAQPEAAAAQPATGTPEAAATLEALPVTPTREQVVAGFDAIVPELAQCAAGKHGVVQISATIAASGRISYALVDGQFQGSPEGSCMVRAVRNARFPQFTQPTLKVSYPVSL